LRRAYGWNLEMQIKAAKQGLRIREIAVDYQYRRGGVSKVSGNLTASIKTAGRIRLADRSKCMSYQKGS